MNTTELEVLFKETFGKPHDGIFAAPGRVNIIGEFTDYNDGFVLPCALDFKTTIVYRTRDDNEVNVYSVNYEGEKDQFLVNSPIEKGNYQWGNYVRSVIYVLQKRGHTLKGADLVIYGTVPQGGGLSSSAALEVAVGGTFNEICELGIEKHDIALIGQQAENEFMGCNCGIMDQLISAKGEKDHALLIDCENLETQSIPFPSNLSLIVINSGYKRELVGSEYNDRRQDCEDAVAALGVKSLRHATLEQLNAAKASMSDNAFKRAHHVITENARTLDAAKALKNSDLPALRQLLAASHDSLRDDFQVTVPATDTLVEICQKTVGEDGASRMTGGGFGGCVIVLCKPEKVDAVLSTVAEEYPKKIGLDATCYVCSAGQGMQKIC